MKTIVFKGFVLASLFTLIGFVASSQDEIAPVTEKVQFKEKVVLQRSIDPIIVKKRYLAERTRIIKANIQALPIEKRELFRKENLPTQ
jgi:hypothetical protein